MYYKSALYDMDSLTDAIFSTIDGYMAGRWTSVVISDDEATTPERLLSPKKITVHFVINFTGNDGEPDATLQGSVECPLIGVAISTQDRNPTELPFD